MQTIFFQCQQIFQETFLGLITIYVTALLITDNLNAVVQSCLEVVDGLYMLNKKSLQLVKLILNDLKVRLSLIFFFQLINLLKRFFNYFIELFKHSLLYFLLILYQMSNCIFSKIELFANTQIVFQ